MTRGNADAEALYGKVFIYDGLYDVTDAAETVGVSGCVTFRLTFRGTFRGTFRDSGSVTSKPTAWIATARVGLS